jgi:membrane dipeptidase
MTATGREYGSRAADLMSEALVWDMTLPWVEDGLDALLLDWKAAGVDFVSLTLAVRGEGARLALERIGRVTACVRAHADEFALAASVDDVLRARERGRLALGLHFQETWPFERLEMVEVFYDLGVRHALLAYNLRNLTGDGCAERADAGLSWYGVDLIGEMNRVGMLVDCTHTGYRTTMEAMELSSAPTIFSHSNPYGVYPHYRNIKDDQIKACAAAGGVIGVNGLRHFLGAGGTIADRMLACVRYLSDLVGPEHVGIGLDHVPGDADTRSAALALHRRLHPAPELGQLPREYAPVTVLSELVRLLLADGFGDDDVRGILGGNFQRVARQVWRS